MTDHWYRVYLIVPAERLASLNAWIAEEIDPTGENWLGLALSADGQEPATHALSSFAATDDEANRWVVRLAAVMGGTVPEGFAQYTRAQKIAYLQAAAPTLRAQTGVWVWICENDGAWLDPEALKAEAGLQSVVQF